METPEIIRQVAFLRLEEAKVLAEHGWPDGAFYLAGYSVELILKAKVAERLGLPGIFDEQSPVGFTGGGEVRRFLKTHNLPLLFVLSALKAKFDRQQIQAANRGEALMVALLNEWSENLRYRSSGWLSVADAQNFIAYLDGSTGLLKWIESN